MINAMSIKCVSIKSFVFIFSIHFASVHFFIYFALVLILFSKDFDIHNILTGDTRNIFVSNIKTVDKSHSARVSIGCKPIL